ncbi:MAG: peptide ABC transporter substrate-binding protein [Fibrobacterota bacterium]
MRLKRIRLITLAVLLTVAVFYVFVKPGEPRADFSLALIGEVKTLDPAINTTLLANRVITALFEGLVRPNPQTLVPEPALARAWEIAPDGLRYTFHLRPSLWSDGTPVTAGDFVYSWERLLNPASLASYDYLLFCLENAERYRQGKEKDFRQVGVTALDDSTLLVALRQPTPYFLDLAGFECLYPVNRRCVETHGIRWTRPGNIVCNGAYRLTQHQLNYKIRLEKNPRYWNAGRVSFNIIDAYTCEGVNTAFNLYETGDAELIEDFPNLIAEEILKRPDKMVAPYLGTYFYRFNVTKKPFDDNRVRRAIDLAVNRADIVRYVTKNGEIPAGTLVPPGMPGYPGIPPVLYNPDSAKKLLAEAGFPGGKGFPSSELLYNTSENHKKIAEAIANMLKQTLGITLVPINMEWKVLLSKMDALDYTIVRGSWIGDYTDPNTFLDMFVTNGGNNRTGWSHPGYDSLIARAGRTLAPAERMPLLAAAEKILVEEGPIINIYYYVTKYLVKPGLRGLYPNLRGYYDLADFYRP